MCSSNVIPIGGYLHEQQYEKEMVNKCAICFKIPKSQVIVPIGLETVNADHECCDCSAWSLCKCARERMNNLKVFFSVKLLKNKD